MLTEELRVSEHDVPDTSHERKATGRFDYGVCAAVFAGLVVGCLMLPWIAELIFTNA